MDPPNTHTHANPKSPLLLNKPRSLLWFALFQLPKEFINNVQQNEDWINTHLHVKVENGIFFRNMIFSSEKYMVFVQENLVRMDSGYREWGWCWERLIKMKVTTTTTKTQTKPIMQSQSVNRYQSNSRIWFVHTY